VRREENKQSVSVADADSGRMLAGCLAPYLQMRKDHIDGQSHDLFDAFRRHDGYWGFVSRDRRVLQSA